ncbi:TPR repeat-containing protein YDR161W [Elysia marginata]|uniref:TPR repeat-containing protein YDR161W n=1 Tax=Elysia marginata TaxID=1093978 RepID=A0AAV4G1H9_9GAST|nr:TPR repeat-containing protein YDR161W [Elysia marginata]
MGKKNFKKRQSKTLGEKKKEPKQNAREASIDEKPGEGQGPQPHPIGKLLDKAEQLIDEFNYELAQKFCQRALEMEPDNVRALETSASLLLELGDIESAKHCLGRAVEVCPETGFNKYMTLGQLMEGATAVQCYQKGVELMLSEKEKQHAEEVAAACSDDRPVTDRDISSAYCAIAELYLTDLCFDEVAEEKCKDFVEKAIVADSENAEAFQLKANFLMSKDEKEEARECIKKSVGMWLPKLQAVDTGNVADEDFDPVEVCPIPFTTRVQCGKILTELGEYEIATDVLETLLDEDDEVPDVWYLLGWANYLQGSEYYSNSRHYLEKGKEVYLKVKHKDTSLLEHMDELLKELGPEPEATENNELQDVIESSDEEDMDHS